MTTCLEFSMNRALHHFSSGDGFAMLSASRSEHTPEENNAASKELEKHLRSIGKGFHKVEGGYVEQTAQGPKQVKERSYFVPGVSKDECRINWRGWRRKNSNRIRSCGVIPRKARI